MAKGRGFKIGRISKVNLQRLTFRIIEDQLANLNPIPLIRQLKHAYRKNPDLVIEVLRWRCGQKNHELFAQKLLEDLPDWIGQYPGRTRTDPEIKRVTDWIKNAKVKKFETKLR